jgi:hypothetical protein
MTVQIGLLSVQNGVSLFTGPPEHEVSSALMNPGNVQVRRSEIEAIQRAVAADSLSYEASRYGEGLLTYALLQACAGSRSMMDPGWA